MNGMIEKYRFYLMLISWNVSFAVFSQVSLVDNPVNFQIEKLMVHTDRQLYISGETIWFKVYAFDTQNHRFSSYSKIGYLELLDQQGISISQVKIFLENGQGSGTVKLPKGVNSGNYTLHAYTQHLRNLGEDFFTKLSLIVLNPEQTIVRSPEGKSNTSEQFTPLLHSINIQTSNYLTIDIKPDQEVYSQREKVTVDITSMDVHGNAVSADLSVSVAMLPPPEDVHAGLFIKKENFRPGKITRREIELNYPAESRGMLLHGKVINNDNPIMGSEAEVYLSFPGETALVYTVISDDQGFFTFLLPNLYGLRQIVIQAYAKNGEPHGIELDDEFHKIKNGNKELFMLPAGWEEIAEATMVNAQIAQAYDAFEEQPEFATQQTFKNVPFYGKPDARYLLDDYTRFPLPEFFFEVVPEVRVRGKYREEIIGLNNEWDFLNKDLPPLLLVDGVPVFDQRTFLKINNQLIRSAEIIISPFWLNPRIFDGIIHITSFDGDARCFTLPEMAVRRSFLMLIPEQKFQVPDYQNKSSSKLPDFRNTLYFNPKIRTDAVGKASFTFPASDVVGTFEIRIEGIAEKGLAGSIKHMIQVNKAIH
jgi:hypothetical protein